MNNRPIRLFQAMYDGLRNEFAERSKTTPGCFRAMIVRDGTVYF